MKRLTPYLTVDRGGYIRFIGSNKLLGRVTRNGKGWEARTMPGRMDSACNLHMVTRATTRSEAVHALARDMCEASNQRWRLEGPF